MKVVAKAIQGKEFFYSARSAHRVPAASAGKILSVLNENRFQLEPGEIWHLYELDEYSGGYDFAMLQRFRIRGGNVYRVRS